MTVYLRLLFAHLPAFIIGLAAVDLLWPRRGPQDFALKLFLAPGLGWGMASCLFFLWSLAFSPFASAYHALEWLLALGLLGLDLYLGRAEWVLASLALRRAAVFPRPNPAVLAAGLVFLFGAVLLWQRADLQPNGNFDAYAVWNMRARFLFLSSAQTWRAAFSPELSWWVHADYPLLWPLTLLRAYLSQNRILTQAGVFQTVVFAWATLGLMMSGLYRLRPGWQACLGGLALLAMPWFIQLSAFQQADVPLAYFYLASLLLLLLASRAQMSHTDQDGQYDQNGQYRQNGLLVLAGLAVGCAVWTKNDGIAWLLAACAVLLFPGLGARGRGRFTSLAAFAFGLVLPLTALILFKFLLAPPGDLVGTQSAAEILAKLASPQRYLVISQAIFALLPSLGGLPWPALAAALLYLLLAGRLRAQNDWRLFQVLLLAFAVYFAVYLITPQPLEWHLGYSLDRLIFHLLLPALFLVLVLTRSPEDLLAELFAPAKDP